MAEELVGNCLVAQSGGPTAVINASLAGVISEALNHECIEEIFGGLNGVQGILQEDLVDLAAESQQTIRGLRTTPAAALGSCRFKLKKSADFERAIEVFKAHNIRFFFYIGGNDSQDTAYKISQLAKERGHEMRVIGIPKTVDNDLPHTDHCPGFGSAAKYVATTVKEIAADCAATGHGDLVQIVEVMGRNAGWIAAASALAKRRESPNDAPHLILLPEVPFSSDAFLDQVRNVLKREKFCLIVVGEGLTDADGNYVATAGAQTDSFGHAALGGAADYLRNLVETNLGLKARAARLGYAQRAAAHCLSQTDAEEAYRAGQAAVVAAVEGHTDKMVTIVRGETDQYTSETSLTNLSEVANHEKKVPADFINDDKFSMNHKFYKYALPLIQGEVTIPYENGVPNFVRLSKTRVERLLPRHIFE